LIFTTIQLAQEQGLNRMKKLVFLCIILIQQTTLQAQTNKGFEMKSERFKQGWNKLKEVDGKAGENVINSLKEIAPEFADLLIEFPFGDIYSRDALDLRSREIATIAALTAMGNATPQLKVHIQAGLNVGLKQKEIVEIIMQMSVYSGFPSALNGLFAAQEVFQNTKE